MLQGAKRFIDWKLIAHCIWPPKKQHNGIVLKPANVTIIILLHIWPSHSSSSPDVHIPTLLLWIWLSLLMSFTTHSFEMWFFWDLRFKMRHDPIEVVKTMHEMLSVCGHTCTLFSYLQIHCPVLSNLQRTWGQVYPCVYFVEQA